MTRTFYKVLMVELYDLKPFRIWLPNLGSNQGHTD